MSKSPKHIVIIAGEESGDQHAASLIKELSIKHNNISISGIGGEHMQKAGMQLVFNSTKLGSTGLTELIKNIYTTIKNFKTIKNHIIKTKPDLLILIDYPEFNLRLAKAIKKHTNIKILYYISPQVWAWRAKRINTIKKVIDYMAVIFPFEKEIYKKINMPVFYVGHPLIDKIAQKLNDKLDNIVLEKLGANSILQDETVIALLPGSRMNEINKHMPILIKTCYIIKKSIPKTHFIIPVAKSIARQSIEEYFYNTNLRYSIIDEHAIESINSSDCVIVASGTASLECALLEKPMCIIYKISPLSAFIGKKLMLIKFLGLCNILSNRLIVPELLQENCRSETIAEVILKILQDKSYKQTMLKDLQNLKSEFSKENIDISLPDLIVKLIYDK